MTTPPDTTLYTFDMSAGGDVIDAYGYHPECAPPYAEATEEPLTFVDPECEGCGGDLAEDPRV